jgi:integrase
LTHLKGSWWRIVVPFGLDCGLRLSELCGLQVKDVDLLSRCVRVRQIVTEPAGRLAVGPPKTKAGIRVVAAAEPDGDPALVWRAAMRIGLSLEAADHREIAGLVEIGGRIVFRHPLVCSAVYQAASCSDSQKVHAALAEMTDSDS